MRKPKLKQECEFNKKRKIIDMIHSIMEEQLFKSFFKGMQRNSNTIVGGLKWSDSHHMGRKRKQILADLLSCLISWFFPSNLGRQKRNLPCLIIFIKFIHSYPPCFPNHLYLCLINNHLSFLLHNFVIINNHLSFLLHNFVNIQTMLKRLGSWKLLISRLLPFLL